MELGIPYDEFFCHLIEEQGGRLPQKTFNEVTNLSCSTVSRLLQEMEEDGQVVRVQVGRENVICLPEHAPSVGFSSPDDNDDALRV